MSTKPLLLNFAQSPTVTGITRTELKEMAACLGTTETAAVHMALARMFQDLFPERIHDDLPSQAEIDAENAAAPGALKTVASLKDLFGGKARAA